MKKNILILISMLANVFAQHFTVDLNETGQSTLFTSNDARFRKICLNKIG